MDFLLLLHNTSLISVTSICLFAAFFAYKKSKETLILVFIFLFSLCFLDNFIINMTETSPFYSLINNNLMNEAYSYKTVILLLTDACYIAINSIILFNTAKLNHFLWVLLHGLIVGISPFFASGDLFFWLYWTLPQLLLIGICIYSLFVLKSSIKIKENLPVKNYFNLLLITIIFNIIIIIEDFYVIFNIDDYTLTSGWVFNRNITEELMTIFIGLIFIIHFIKRPWSEKEMFTALPLIKPKIVEASPENQDKADLTAFERFCINYSFTDREVELFKYMLEKRTNIEISEKLFISIGTVKTHTHHIYQKAGVTKRSALIKQFTAFKQEYETLHANEQTLFTR